MGRLPVVGDFALGLWSGDGPFECGGNQRVRLHGLTARLPGRTAVRLRGHCWVEIDDCTLEAATAIDADDSAHVVLRGGHIVGSKLAISVLGGASIDMEDVNVTGGVTLGHSPHRVAGKSIFAPFVSPSPR